MKKTTALDKPTTEYTELTEDLHSGYKKSKKGLLKPRRKRKETEGIKRFPEIRWPVTIGRAHLQQESQSRSVPTPAAWQGSAAQPVHETALQNSLTAASDMGCLSWAFCCCDETP